MRSKYFSNRFNDGFNDSPEFWQLKGLDYFYTGRLVRWFGVFNQCYWRGNRLQDYQYFRVEGAWGTNGQQHAGSVSCPALFIGWFVLGEGLTSIWQWAGVLVVMTVTGYLISQTRVK